MSDKDKHYLSNKINLNLCISIILYKLKYQVNNILMKSRNETKVKNARLMLGILFIIVEISTQTTDILYIFMNTSYSFGIAFT